MIRFILEKIRLRNVRCYGDEPMEMDFPLNNLTVFTGHVGAGKSTIVKAVSMALYGEDGGVKGEKLSIDDIINEKNGKNLEIDLYFRSEDTLNPEAEPDKYEIHLYHKHSMYGSKLVFIKNGQDISANGKLDTYRLIEKTLIPKQVYHNIYYFTQQAKNFFTALPNSEQKEIFDSILDLSEYDEFYENAKNIHSESVSKLEQLNQKKSMIQDNIQLLVSTISNMKEKLEEDKKFDLIEKDRLRSIIDISNKQLDDIRQKIESIGTVEVLSDKKQKLFDKYNELVTNIKSNIAGIEAEKNNIQQNFKNKFEMAKSESNSKLEKIQSEIDKLNQKYNSDLELLKIEYNNSDISIKQSLEKELTDIKISYSEEQKNLQMDQVRLTSQVNQIKSIKQTKISELYAERESELKDFEKSIRDINHKIDILKERIRTRDESIRKSQQERDSYIRDKDDDNAICRLCGQPLKNKDHIENHILNLDNTISESKKLLDGYQNQTAAYEDEIAKIQFQVIKINTEYESKIKAVEDDNSESSELKSKISDISQRLTNIEIDIESKNSEIYSKYSKIANETRKEYEQKISDLNSRLEKSKFEYSNEKTNLSSQLINLKNQLQTEYNLSVQEIANKLSSLEESKNKLDLDYQKKNSEIDTLLSQNRECQHEMKSINDNLVAMNSKLKDLEDKVYDETSILDIDNKKQTLLQDIQELDNQISEVSEDIEISNFWKNSFSNSGIKSMLIDSAIPHMNECVRNELDRVAPGLFTVSFDTLSQTKSGNIRDKFAINIVHNLKGSTGHKKLSGGEKRIVDLCCMTALRSLAENLYNKKFCHIFYDEILDSLDTECKEQFCRNAKLQSESGMNITLITHDIPEDVDPDRVFPF